MAKQSLTDERMQKRVFWKRHINEWGRSEITQTEYCRQHKLSTKSFTYWKRRLKNRQGKTHITNTFVRMVKFLSFQLMRTLFSMPKDNSIRLGY